MKHIQIVYKTTLADFVELNIAPADYYDPLEPGQTYEQDGIPKHTDPLDYIPQRADQVELAVIREPCGDGTKEFRIEQLNGRRAYCLHSLWPDGKEELIHSTDLDDDTYHITRTLKDANGYWTVTVNMVCSSQYFI